MADKLDVKSPSLQRSCGHRTEADVARTIVPIDQVPLGTFWKQSELGEDLEFTSVSAPKARGG